MNGRVFAEERNRGFHRVVELCAEPPFRVPEAQWGHAQEGARPWRLALTAPEDRTPQPRNGGWGVFFLPRRPAAQRSWRAMAISGQVKGLVCLVQ